MKNRFIYKYSFVFILAFLVFFIVGTFFVQLYVPVSLSENADGVRIEIPSGTSTMAISNILKEKKLIRSKLFFYGASRFPALTGKFSPLILKSGVYTIYRNMNCIEIIRLLESGQQEYIKTVFPEGLTITKIALILEDNGVCKSDDFIISCKNKLLLDKYGIPASTCEGFLFPDTYYFTPSMKSDSVVEMMIDNFIQKTSSVFFGKSVNDYYKTLILASVVEREYRVDKEAPLIASVFTNRIKENIGLYSCATIEYIITEIQGRPHPDVITYDDLKIDSPYNTYKWAGLPPTPISNPGLIAINAAVNPPLTDYYFFTLSDENSGTHTFTRNFTSHTRAGSQFKTKKAASSR